MNTSGIITILTLKAGSGVDLITMFITPESICHFKTITRRTATYNLFVEQCTDMPGSIESTIPACCPENWFLLSTHVLPLPASPLYKTNTMDALTAMAESRDRQTS